jgi:hypothetical protein
VTTEGLGFAGAFFFVAQLEARLRVAGAGLDPCHFLFHWMEHAVVSTFFPDFVEPCVPSPANRLAAGRDWVHEIKHEHDGFRLLARRGAERVRLFSRNGHDWTERFALVAELYALKCPPA